ncbi:MAG: response regulator transcription factor [Desulfomonile tiedjei]|uniref:Response regulator transcription factor n=1 Tax=Desulfomonile tiedjei TaxID=2358 RepID=A0A9D6V4Z5_9BACT|nr:response regulator transcription factor [Desulfomonile tiedjei]
MAKEKVLVVDDDEDILELVRYNLAKEGYQVHCVPSGEQALKKAREDIPDLILLDLMLPGLDGLDVCRQLRNSPETSGIPIIMITAKGEDADIVSGLELGADDYVIKPFSPRVLLARIKKALRKTKPEEPDESSILRIHELLINPARHEVLVKDSPMVLTVSEFRILHFLARRPGWVFSRDQIITAVKGDDYPVTERSVDVQIVGLRKKLGSAGNYIETVRGVGYRFKEQP